MKSIKKAFLLIFLLPLPLTAAREKTASTMPPKVLLRNLIMIIDANEQTPGTNFVMSLNLAVALCQQAAPILVYFNTVKNLFILHDQIDEFSSQFLPEEFLSLKNFLHHKLQDILSQWDIYETTEDYLLFVPRQYLAKKQQELAIEPRLGLIGGIPVQQIAQEYRSNLLNLKEQTDIILGFDIKNQKKFKEPVSVAQLKKEILQKSSANVPLYAKDIINLFIPPKKEKFGNYMWNIYLVGHGIYPIDRKDRLPAFFEHRDWDKPFDLDTNFTAIAGLGLQEFKMLVNWFNTINTNFFAYNSCYAGGFNRALPFVTQLIYGTEDSKKNIIGGIEPNFIVVVASLTDADVNQYINFDLQCNSKEVPANYLNYRAFFDRLSDETQKFLQQKTKGMSREFLQNTFKPSPVRLNNNQLRSILKPIYSWCSHTDKINHPLVLFPHTGVFTLVPLDEDVIILTRPKIEVAARTNGIVDIKSIRTKNNRSMSPEYIFLTTASLPITLKITTPTMPTLFSLLPGVGVHTIKSIEAPHISYTDFARSFPLFQTVFPKYFFIEKLVIQKDEQLKDVFFVKGNSNTLYDVLIISSNQMDEKTPTVRSDLFFRTSETTAYHTVERVELEIAQETLLGCPTKKEAEQEQKSIKEAVNRMSTTQLQLASKSWQIAHEKNPAKNAAFNYITRDLPDLSEIQVMPLMEYFKLWQAQPSTIAT